MHALNRTLLAFVTLSLCLFAHAVEFEDAKVLVETDQPIELARNPRGAIVVDSSGTAHVVYFKIDNASVADNQILYVSSNGGEGRGPVRVDSSDASGGRHPFMAIGPNDEVFTVWQDNRHTTAAGNFFDNIEIYLDHKPAGGSFSDADIRLSNTNSGHAGDNGFTPTVAVGDDGVVHVVWYDFARDGELSFVYSRSSVGGEFDDASGIEPFRITGADMGGADVSHWMPDIVALPNGAAYVAWGMIDGFQGYFELQGRRINGDGSLSSIEPAAAEGATFFDPPRLAAGANGAVYLAYSNQVDGLSHVFVQRRSSGGVWSDPIAIDDGAFAASQISVVESGGSLYAVWQEDLGGVFQIMVGVIDVTTFDLRERMVLSDDLADARTPSIAVNPSGDSLSVVWLERDDDGTRRLMLKRKSNTTIPHWGLY